MKRINANEVELTADEVLVREIHSNLMDAGLTQGDAVIFLRGSQTPEGLKGSTPRLDATLTPAFVDWLVE